MSKICIVATSGVSLTNFRGSLIYSWISMGHKVTCISIETHSDMASSIGALGAEYYQVEGSRTGTSVAEGFRMIERYKEAFRMIKPDYVFLYMGKPIMFGGYAAYKVGIKHISLLVNGLEMAFYSNGTKNRILRVILSTMYRFVCAKAENVVMQNGDDKDFFLRRHICKSNKMRVVNGSGVDMSYFKKEPMPGKPVVLMVARLLWSKGIREYLDAVATVKKRITSAHFMLVGGLDENDEAISKAELDRFITDYDIEYCGYAADVRPYLKRCSIFVLPSYHEGVPRSVLEAMATGRPIITTDAPGCKETVLDGVNGFLVPVKNSSILADRIEKLCFDEGLRKMMADKSYELCRDKFDVNIINNEINRIMFAN